MPLVLSALGIESLQKMGAQFLLCANALGVWCLELQARGKGNADDVEKTLRAHVPASRSCRRW